MSLSPIALEALRAAQSAFTTVDADVFEDALARGLEAADREGRIVGAFQAQELKRLEARVAELEQQIAALSAQGQVLRSRPVPSPEGEFHSFLDHPYKTPHDLDLPGAGDRRV